MPSLVLPLSVPGFVVYIPLGEQQTEFVVTLVDNFDMHITVHYYGIQQGYYSIQSHVDCKNQKCHTDVTVGTSIMSAKYNKHSVE